MKKQTKNNNEKKYSNNAFILESCRDILEVRDWINFCEGMHTQQVCYSTFHDCLTQICYDCKKIRSNIKNG